MAIRVGLGQPPAQGLNLGDLDAHSPNQPLFQPGDDQVPDMVLVGPAHAVDLDCRAAARSFSEPPRGSYEAEAFAARIYEMFATQPGGLQILQSLRGHQPPAPQPVGSVKNEPPFQVYVGIDKHEENWAKAWAERRDFSVRTEEEKEEFEMLLKGKV